MDLSSAFGVPEFLASTGAVITARAANETARIAFLSCNFAIEALPDLSRRYAADDSVGCYIAGDHGSGGQNGAVAHLHARHHDDGMADPDIVPDQNAIGASLPKEVMVPLRVSRVVLGTIGKSMLRRAVERMIWRADAHLGAIAQNRPICASATMQPGPR